MNCPYLRPTIDLSQKAKLRILQMTSSSCTPQYTQTDPCWVAPKSTPRNMACAHLTRQIAFLWSHSKNFEIALSQKSWQKLLSSFNGFHFARSSFYAISELLVRMLNSHGIWCSPDIFQVTTLWSFQLQCRACMDSLGSWKWTTDVTDDTSWTYLFQVSNFVVEQLDAAGTWSCCIRRLADKHLIWSLSALTLFEVSFSKSVSLNSSTTKTLLHNRKDLRRQQNKEIIHLNHSFRSSKFSH